MSWKLRILIIICQVAQCICGEPNRKEAFNIGHSKTFAIVYNRLTLKILKLLYIISNENLILF